MAKKRSFRKLNGGKSYRAWKNWDVGDTIVGKYVGDSVDNYDKPNWHIQIEECDFSEESANIEAGKTIGLNSAGGLDKAMDNVEIGQFVEITYQGTSVLEKGKFAGKEAHNIEVSVCDDEMGEPDGDESEDYGL